MMDPVFLVLCISAIIVMSYALYRVLGLRKKVQGGAMGSTLDLLIKLISLFLIGYAVAPFFSKLPQFSTNLVAGILFFCVSVFVVLVIDLFYIIASDMKL